MVSFSALFLSEWEYNSFLIRVWILRSTLWKTLLPFIQWKCIFLILLSLALFLCFSLCLNINPLHNKYRFCIIHQKIQLYTFLHGIYNPFTWQYNDASELNSNLKFKIRLQSVINYVKKSIFVIAFVMLRHFLRKSLRHFQCCKLT